MITYNDARRLAETWVDIVSRGEATIVDRDTVTRPYGWVFFWQSKVYLQSQDYRDGALGNAPLIVDRVNGELRVTGTAHPVEHYLREYEATLPPARLKMMPSPPPGIR